MTVSAASTTRIPTGIAIAIPIGYEGQIRARSSLGAKGLIMPNGVGTIDADYRGELQILVAWIGAEESFTIEAGERIAQIIIAPIPAVRFVEVEGGQLGETERGSEGFGSTGRF
jgi:dUTP pyrophosphatase